MTTLGPRAKYFKCSTTPDRGDEENSSDDTRTKGLAPHLSSPLFAIECKGRHWHAWKQRWKYPFRTVIWKKFKTVSLLDPILLFINASKLAVKCGYSVEPILKKVKRLSDQIASARSCGQIRKYALPVCMGAPVYLASLVNKMVALSRCTLQDRNLRFPTRWLSTIPLDSDTLLSQI